MVDPRHWGPRRPLCRIYILASRILPGNCIFLQFFTGFCCFFPDFWQFFGVFFGFFSVPDPDLAVLDPNTAASERVPR